MLPARIETKAMSTEESAIYVDEDMNAWAVPDFAFPTARTKYVEAAAFDALRAEVDRLSALNQTQEESITEFQREQKELQAQIDKIVNSDFVCSRCGSPKK